MPPLTRFARLCRHHYIGIPSVWLDSTKYQQMAGRAGRAGIDEAGEAILLATRDKRANDHLFKLMRVRRNVGAAPFTALVMLFSVASIRVLIICLIMFIS